MEEEEDMYAEAFALLLVLVVQNTSLVTAAGNSQSFLCLALFFSELKWWPCTTFKQNGVKRFPQEKNKQKKTVQ